MPEELEFKAECGIPILYVEDNSGARTYSATVRRATEQLRAMTRSLTWQPHLVSEPH